MKDFFKQIFIWWSGNTIGTRFFTWRKGTYVGKDQFGNIYYEGSCEKDGNSRRWVIYKNYSEASSIPPGWHGWIHHRTDIPPSKEDYQPKAWEDNLFLPNQTGSSHAYRPKRLLNKGNGCSRITGEYQAWSPKK